MVYHADVVIAGAAPVGLSLASITSKHCKTVVIDQADIPSSTKTWNIWSDTEELLPASAIAHRAKRGVFSSYLGPSVENYDALTITTDEDEVLNHFYEMFRSNGGEAFENCAYVNHRVHEGGVLIRTREGEINAKLLVDAMGSESPIVRDYDPADKFWSCYGHLVTNMNPKLPHLEDETSLILDNVFANDPRIYFMFFPLKHDGGYPIVFLLGEKRYSIGEMQDAFEEVRHNDKFEGEFANADLGKQLHGYIPLRRRPIKNLERLLFVGDAAGWAPPITGCGFNEGMDAHQDVAHGILDTLKEGDFSARRLNRVYKMSAQKKMNRDLQSVLYSIAMNSTDQEVAKMILTMKTIGPEAEENFIQCKMTHREIISAIDFIRKEIPPQRLMQMVPAKEYPLIPRLISGLYWGDR